MTENSSQRISSVDEQMEGDVSILDLAISLAKHKNLIVITPIIVGFFSLLYSLTIPNTYTADTKILPPQQQSSAAAMLLATQLGGMGSSLGIKSPNDIYIAMLHSRNLQDRMARRFNLQQVYHTQTPGQTRDALAGVTKVTTGREGLISVSVDDTDPKRAALLANGYIEELQNLTQVLAVTEASQRRLFYEKQLLQTKQQLSDAETALKQTQESTGLIQLDSQAAGLVQATASIRAQIAMKEVQLGAMRTFATGNNPEFIRAQQELAGLRGQLSKVETGSVNAGKAPAAGLEYIRKVRDVKYYEAIYELLGKQFEMAKLDEAKQSSPIQVLDKADPPELKSKPKRSQIVVIAVLAAFILSVIWAFISEAMKRSNEDSEQNARLKQLRQILRWR